MVQTGQRSGHEGAHGWASASPVAVAARRTVMLVEDDYDVRDSLRDVLEDVGYHVVAAAEGGEAMRLLAIGPRPDVILLDLMMPGMDGFAFREALRRQPSLTGIPLVLLTADRAAREVAGQLGAAGYLTKPARVEDLLQLLGVVADAP